MKTLHSLSVQQLIYSTPPAFPSYMVVNPGSYHRTTWKAKSVPLLPSAIGYAQHKMEIPCSLHVSYHGNMTPRRSHTSYLAYIQHMLG